MLIPSWKRLTDTTYYDDNKQSWYAFRDEEYEQDRVHRAFPLCACCFTVDYQLGELSKYLFYSKRPFTNPQHPSPYQSIYYSTRTQAYLPVAQNRSL